MNLDQILKLAAEVQALREKLTTAEEALRKATGGRGTPVLTAREYAGKPKAPRRYHGRPPKPGTKMARVLELLRTGQTGPRDLAKASGFPENFVASCLSNLRLRGYVEPVSRGVWRAA